MAGRPFVAYLASWTEVKTANPAETLLARLPGYLTHVPLGFVKPDLVYAGDLDLAGTGLQVPYSGAVLKGAIAALKARHPQVKVLLAVGGWGYFGWDGRNFPALARLVKDLGADGVDLDYETADAGCVRSATGTVACADDARAVAVLEDLRAALPRPYVVSLAGWSVGAYGEGAFLESQPKYGPFVGMMRAVLKSRAAQGIDVVSIMSYDAGPTFRPDEAFRAYRSLWRGPLAIGIQVLPPAAGGQRYSIARTVEVLNGVRADPKGGAMLYGLGLVPPGTLGPDNPDYRALSLAICVTLELAGCGEPMP